VFGIPRTQVRCDVFVLMPFELNLRIIYTDVIQPAVESLGLTVMRADEMPTTNEVVMDIWDCICGAELLIADCTNRNPNVFYEIGMAHTVGRPVLLIAQTIESIPFDVKHIRHLIYENNDAGLATLLESLKESVKLLFFSERFVEKRWEYRPKEE